MKLVQTISWTHTCTNCFNCSPFKTGSFSSVIQCLNTPLANKFYCQLRNRTNTAFQIWSRSRATKTTLLIINWQVESKKLFDVLRWHFNIVNKVFVYRLKYGSFRLNSYLKNVRFTVYLSMMHLFSASENWTKKNFIYYIYIEVKFKTNRQWYLHANQFEFCFPKIGGFLEIVLSKVTRHGL